MNTYIHLYIHTHIWCHTQRRPPMQPPYMYLQRSQPMMVTILFLGFSLNNILVIKIQNRPECKNNNNKKKKKKMKLL